MANSTKVAIVGLMILLVVVVAKYVKTGAPVNGGRTDSVVSTGETDGESVVSGNAETNRGATRLPPRKPFFRTPSSNGGRFVPIGRTAEPVGTLPPVADVPIVTTESKPQGLVGEAEEGTPGEVAVGTDANTPLPPESNTLIEERAATAASPVADTPGEGTIADGFGTTVEAPPTRTFSANPPANKTRVAKVPGYPKKHTIKKGESYWVLAAQYYGKGYLHPRISKANKGVRFQPGKVVVIPSPPPEAVKQPKKQVAEKTKKRAAPNPPKAAAPAAKTLPKDFYTVKKDDTLAGIAEKLLGSTKYKNRFYAVNKALDLEFTGDLIYTGMRLRVPKL